MCVYVYLLLVSVSPLSWLIDVHTYIREYMHIHANVRIFSIHACMHIHTQKEQYDLFITVSMVEKNAYIHVCFHANKM
jgi:hypothetical protein